MRYARSATGTSAAVREDGVAEHDDEPHRRCLALRDELRPVRDARRARIRRRRVVGVGVLGLVAAIGDRRKWGDAIAPAGSCAVAVDAHGVAAVRWWAG